MTRPLIQHAFLLDGINSLLQEWLRSAGNLWLEIRFGLKHSPGEHTMESIKSSQATSSTWISNTRSIMEVLKKSFKIQVICKICQ